MIKYKEKRKYTKNEIAEKECFNKNMAMAVWCLEMRDKYNIKTVVETGTYLSRTTKFLAKAFEKVYTIDILEEFIKQAKEKFKGCNVECVCGNSINILEPICRQINKGETVLFLLDAHGNYTGDLILLGLVDGNKDERPPYYSNKFDPNQCPTKQEIEIISRYFKDKCIIMVDDVLNPNDKHGHYINFGGVSLDYDYLKDALNKCYSGPYKYEHIRETSLGWPKSRLLVEPNI